jgi:hypothetical protein
MYCECIDLGYEASERMALTDAVSAYLNFELLLTEYVNELITQQRYESDRRNAP